MKKALIITGGSIDRDFSLQLLEKECFDYLIAADSGMRFFYEVGILPQLIVGDFDSADPEILAYYREQTSVEICRLNPIKDDTDTEHAIRTAIAMGAEEITLLGATGTRLDHVLGNLTMLGIGLENPKHPVSICMVDSHNRIRMIHGPLTLRKRDQFGSFVSLLPFAGAVEGITLTGMKYPLTDYTMEGFNSLGVSNEITGEVAEIQLKKGYLLVIESRD